MQAGAARPAPRRHARRRLSVSLERGGGADDGARVGGGLEQPVGGHGDAVGVAEHRPERRRRLDEVTRSRRIAGQAGGAWSSMTTVGCTSPSHVSNPVAGPRSTTRGAATASAAVAWSYRSRAASWATIAGWASPPADPSTARTAPSRVASAGTSVCGGRRPAVSSAGCPGARENPSPRLCRLMPVVGSTSHEPKPDGVRLDQADGPPAVVGRAQVRRVAGVGCQRQRGRAIRVDRARRAVRRARAGRPPSASSWSTSGRSNEAAFTASTNRWARSTSSGEPGSPTRWTSPAMARAR